MGLTTSDDYSGLLPERDRYLPPGERAEVVVHRHPAVLVGPVLAVLIWLAISGWLSVLPKISGIAVLAIWLAWFLLLLRLVWKILNWLFDYRVVTSDRMLFISGVVARDIVMIPYAQLIDMSYRRSQLGIILGYGSLILEVDDQIASVWKIDFLPFPEQLYQEIISAVDRYRSPPDD